MIIRKATSADAKQLTDIATFARPGTAQRGIGSARFEVTKNARIKAGYSEIYARICANNTGGLAYYEKMGFSNHLLDKAVSLKDGTPIDRITKRVKRFALNLKRRP